MFCNCVFVFVVFFFMQKTAYEMRISDWSSDVCSSDLTCRVWLPDTLPRLACWPRAGMGPLLVRRLSCHMRRATRRSQAARWRACASCVENDSWIRNSNVRVGDFRLACSWVAGGLPKPRLERPLERKSTRLHYHHKSTIKHPTHACKK